MSEPPSPAPPASPSQQNEENPASPPSQEDSPDQSDEMAMVKYKASTEQYARPEKGFEHEETDLKADAFAGSLSLTWQTTKGVATELNDKITSFAQKAEKRVSDLVKMIQDLHREMEDARTALSDVNPNIQASLRKVLSDPLEWHKDQETLMSPKK